MKRRDFLKTLAVMPLLSISAWSSDNIKTISHLAVSMNGFLDDDLFVMTANKDNWDIKACQQMHNPTTSFFLEGRVFPSVHIPGYIEYNQVHSIDKNEILVLALANEREEREPDKSLLDRTHYKSVELLIDKNILIPSMIPENNDIPDYTTWYDPSTDDGAYNYYRLWENAIVNVGIVVQVPGVYTIALINAEGDISATISTKVIEGQVSNPWFKESLAGPIQAHTLAEVDGGVFMHDKFRASDDKTVKELAAYNLLITTPVGHTIRVPMPYPFPYLNRMFITCEKAK